MGQNSKFLIPNSLFTCQRTRGACLRRAFPSAAKRELTPLGLACQQLFFEPRSFFSERAARVSPRRRSGNLSPPRLAVNRFLLLFSKNFRPAVPCLSALPGSARHSVPQRREQVMHLHAASVNGFLFFSDFFLPILAFLPCFRSG